VLVVAASGGGAAGRGVTDGDRLAGGGGQAHGKRGRPRAGVAFRDHHVIDGEGRNSRDRPSMVIDQDRDVVAQLLAVAASSQSSPLKSPAANPRGYVPAAAPSCSEKVPSPWPSRTLASPSECPYGLPQSS